MILKEFDYYELCMIVENEKSFCYYDFIYYNIILSENMDVYVIDFDYCKREVRIFDISNFMIKVLKRVDWNLDFVINILNLYNLVLELKLEEYKVLYVYF